MRTTLAAPSLTSPDPVTIAVGETRDTATPAVWITIGGRSAAVGLEYARAIGEALLTAASSPEPPARAARPRARPPRLASSLA